MTVLNPIDQILPSLVRPEKKESALSNWNILSPLLTSWNDENKRALVATILVETGNTFEPVKEIGGDDYYIRMYWKNKSVREMLGNTFIEDAVLYCGKGFIQVTGRNNYEWCACALNLPLMHQPELLLQPGNSARAAVWFWERAKIAPIVDEVSKYTDPVLRDKIWTQVRRKVNGGIRGLEPFLAHLTALGVR